MKKLLSLTLALAMLLALAAGCVPSDQEVGTSPEVTQSQSDTQSPAPGGEVTATPDAGPKEINYARAYDATTLDPHMAQDDGSYDILYLTGEGLVRERNG
jgi:ABC-type oligopeptide transport system substrate-binding subunit